MTSTSQVKPQGYTKSAFDGMSVKNIYSNVDSHREILFAQQETYFNPALTCASGVSNIDNACLCQGSPNTSPFNQEPAGLMRQFFVPDRPTDFPQPTPSQRCIMNERAPYGKREPYEPTLGSCEYANRCMK